MAAKQGATQNRKAKRAQSEGSFKDGGSNLSLERIADAAVALLDASGVDGLTMRRLADHLDAGTMSVYWHVANKNQVFDLALNSVLSYRASTEKDGAVDWRSDITDMLEDWRACMLRHPWSISLLPSRALGRSILERLEWLGQTLAKAGLADTDINVAIWSFWNHVMGATVTKGNFDRTKRDRNAETMQSVDIADAYPSIARTRLLLDDGWDGAFRKGVDLLIDGLVAKR
ncbi:TetR/AcrR family transcriptional regulator C-terminal domain-containing protein [Rhizobium sp. CFBP 8762]|uniref:TetR/AcrR family transcriptional regulator C-terminal domain-containing protein n=1 Tax=Rhizobium sp. CFBP 8762 TaxID=2775279 RepID=UPI0017836F65|nr:TetR/AcrR family transcriptional regulator C-terminal domain-containing protein [Rhizobium sp. CFBP 8762]MBD8556382.1 TetR/AcrR family transcriptional regulator C-terminal domain-containing protein [Rhizobium sp. CFBP 8762]